MKLRRVEIHGFKSFGRKTVLEFPEGISAIVGPNGGGKCVTGDTRVLLADGSIQRIDELVNSRLHKALPMDDGLLALGDGTKVLSLGDDLKIHRRPVQAFVRRLAPESLICIKTRAGRVITATPYHPLFVLRDGEIRAARADKLTEGTRIAVPRAVELPEPDKTFIELLDTITEKDAIYVPYDKTLADIVRKRGSYLLLAKQAGIPQNAIKGLLDRQSINFSHCVKLLRALGLSDEDIIRMIPTVKAKNSSILCKISWRNTLELARLLGYLLAEGRFPPDSDQLWFTNGNDEIVQDYVDCMGKSFGIRTTTNEYKASSYDVLAYSKPARVILEKLGMAVGGTIGKTITNLFFKHAGVKEIAALLNGLYCGDGYVGPSRIEITTKSPSLAEAIQVALLRLGIASRRKKVVKIATNSGFSGVYENVGFYDVSNFKTFADNIELVHPEKAKRVRELLDKTANPNVDLLEVNDIVKQAVREQEINVKRNRRQFPKLDAYVYNGCLPSRTGVQELVDNVFGRSKSALLLRSLCTSHIFWDEISSIEKIEPDCKWVYDLCVEGDHNFIANNIFVHNSNIIDAICFALGYPSRDLRAAKAHELIYSGKAGNVPYAKVSIIFQKGEEFFEVKRKVDRSGRSVYKLNTVTTSLEDLQDTLSKHSIPKDGFNIVMQNDVNRFIEVRPLERRRLLDEISGISGYEEKKKRALEELGVVERRISDTSLVLSEKKGYLDEIGKDREAAVKYRAMQDELKKGKSVYFYGSLYSLENDAGQIEERAEKVSKGKDLKITELSRLDEEVYNIEQNLDKTTKRILASSSGESGKIKGDIGALKSGIERKQEEIQFLKGEITVLEGKKTKNSEKQKQLRNDIKVKEEELKKLKAEVEKAGNDVESKEKEREGKAKGYDNKEMLALDDERKAVSEALYEAKKSLTILEKELDIADRRERELKKLVSEKGELLKSTNIELAALDREVAKLGAEAEKIEKASKELEDARTKLSELFQEFARLESEIQTIERIELRSGASESLKFVLVNKEKGYLGQVSELGSSPEKYKLALEVAAGDKSKCLVVKDDATAQFYIEGLRKGKIGRATFLPLNKVHGPEVKEVKGEGVVGYAKDLIKCDKKYQKVFDFIFGDTLVVKDLGAARSVGIGSIKMATLDGDLVAAGGAMTGGYYEKVAISFSSTADKKKRLEEIKSEIATLKDEKGKLEKGLEGVDKINVGVMRERKANLGEKAEGLGKELSKLEQELAGLDSQRKSLTTKKTESEKSVAKLEKELAAVDGKMNAGAFAEMRSILETIDSQIHDLKEGRFVLQSKENAAKADISGMESRIKDIDRQTEEIDESVSKFKKKIQESIDQITGGGRKLRELEETHSLVTAESQKLFQEQEQLNQLMKELGEKKGGLEAEIDKLRDEATSLEVRKAKIDAKLEEVKNGMQGVGQPTKKDLEGVNLNKLKNRIRELEEQLGAIQGVNLRAVDMYDELQKQYAEIKEKNEKLQLEKEKIYDLIETIEEKKKVVFYDAFHKVKDNFCQIIPELYPETSGELILENETDPFNSGLIIRVKPRGKEGINIDALSGGEKALTALAFLMATHSVTPSPFYILDEVDAALDPENVLRLVSWLKGRKHSQFILISHNPETVKHMDSVIGVHMQDGISQIVGVNMKMAEA